MARQVKREHYRFVTGQWLAIVLIAASLSVSVTAAARHKSHIKIGIDGGYSDILVRISEDLPPTNCRTVLKNLQDILRTSSLGLNSAMEGKAYFQSFLMFLPQSWTPSECGYTESRLSPVAGSPYNRNSDLLVGPSHPVHGPRPFVHHSAGCGVMADEIYVPTTFLDAGSLNITEGAKEMVDKWIDFRYGVFPEEDLSRESAAADRLENGSISTSKQMAVCNGRSRQEVIQSHQDFIGIRTDNEPMRAIVPEIRIVRQPKVKYVLAIETTASMGEEEHWKWVNKAAQKLIRYDLPAGTEMALVTFNNQTRVEHPMVALRDEDDSRAKLADAVPGKYHVADHNVRCVACILQTLVRNVLNGDQGAPGTHVILVTRAGTDSLSITDEKIISEYVKNYGIRISTIMLPLEDHLPFYDEISQVSGGRTYLVRNTGFPMDAYVAILNAFQSVLTDDSVVEGSGSQTVTLHTNEHYTEGGSNTTTGVFVVESAPAEWDTVLGIYVEDPEDHLIKSVTLEDEEGTVYGPYSKMSTTFDLINFKTVNVVGELPLSSNKNSKWKYKIEWFPYYGDVRKSLVKVTSTKISKEDAGSSQLIIDSWASQTKSLGGYNPVELFVKVTKSNGPVLDAKIFASVETEDMNGTVRAVTVLELADDGLGDSDVIAGDGIYSGILTEYHGAGRYSFTVYAEDNLGRAFILSPSKVEIPCCEDFSAIPQERRLSTGPFSRIVPGPVLHLAATAIGDHDFAPPAKINDFLIELSPDNKTFLATWTSPGDDFQKGTASGYVFVYSTNITQLLRSASSQGTELAKIDKTSQSGSKTSQLIEFPFYDKQFYIGIRAYDEVGNIGRLSNLQGLYIDEPVVPTTAEPFLSSAVSLGLPPSTTTDWVMIIAISCGLGGLLVICIISISYYLITTKRRRPESPSPSSDSGTGKDDLPGADHTDSSSCHSDRQGSTQLDVKELEQQVTDLHQIIGDHRVTPVYWSASQLLSKLEYPDRLMHQINGVGQDLPPTQSYGYYSDGAIANDSNFGVRLYSSGGEGFSDRIRSGSLNRTLVEHQESSTGRDHQTARPLDAEYRPVIDSHNHGPPHPAVRTHQPLVDNTNKQLGSSSTTATPARTPRSERHHQRSSRFERNNFYRSSRMLGSARFYPDEDSYQGFGTPVPPPPATSEAGGGGLQVGIGGGSRDDIPDEFCVTVSSIATTTTSDTEDSASMDHVTGKPVARPRLGTALNNNANNKPRNITEV